MKTIDRHKALEKTCFLTRASGDFSCCEGPGCMAWESRGPTAGACLLIPDAKPEKPALSFDLYAVLDLLAMVKHGGVQS